MLPERYIFPRRLNESVALQSAADLAQLDAEPGGQVVLDFAKTEHFEPFAMLLVGSAIRRLRHRAELAGADIAIPIEGLGDGGLAGHMGFWKSIGAPLGREVNSTAPNQSYLPITRLDIGQMYREGGDPRGSGLVFAEASRLAQVLCQPSRKILDEALTYSLRELIRNVIEHAMAPDIWIAGMSWPKRDYVQIAILDEGRGVRASLADHPEFQFPTDEAAIAESIRRGVSRNHGRTRTPAEVERWEEEKHALPLSLFENAGYGLYMISTFCREAGQFLIASGSSYHAYIANAELVGSTLHRGTALRIVLEPTKVGPAFEKLFESVGEQGIATKPLLSASKLRKLGLDSLFGTAGESDRQTTESDVSDGLDF